MLSPVQQTPWLHRLVPFQSMRFKYGLKKEDLHSCFAEWGYQKVEMSQSDPEGTGHGVSFLDGTLFPWIHPTLAFHQLLDRWMFGGTCCCSPVKALHKTNSWSLFIFPLFKMDCLSICWWQLLLHFMANATAGIVIRTSSLRRWLGHYIWGSAIIYLQIKCPLAILNLRAQMSCPCSLITCMLPWECLTTAC